MKIINVVAGIIQNFDGRILLARRKPGSHLEGYWEFPGGKIEDGESAEASLERELIEELGISTKTGQFFAESVYTYDYKKIRLLAYFSTYLKGEFVLESHDQVVWVTVNEALGYYLAPADVPIMKALHSMLASTNNSGK